MSVKFLSEVKPGLTVVWRPQSHELIDVVIEADPEIHYMLTPEQATEFGLALLAASADANPYQGRTKQAKRIMMDGG